MRYFFLASLLVVGIAYVGAFHVTNEEPASREQAAPTITPTPADANRLLRGQPGFFVPNLGQWDHAARFVHRSGPMTLFLEDRGWVIDLVERPAKPKARPHEPVFSDAHQAMPRDGKMDQKIRGVALRMTFEGDGHVREIVGEKKLAGHHNYFLGNDENCWRTDVPLYSSVHYEGLYPGIDLRLREMNGVPEYDLLLQPGADLSRVSIYVEGGKRLSIAKDGSLIIDTTLGPMTQSAPKTWQVDENGRKRDVVCNFTLLGTDRFGFAAPDWEGDTSLTIDPGLIWSTYFGGDNDELIQSMSVDASGVVTAGGSVSSINATNFPTTVGAYDRTHNGGTYDVFISRLDPSRTGSAQLVYSTYLGGKADDEAFALSVDASGIVTVAGSTASPDFPTTNGSYDTIHNGERDAFVSRLDPSKTGTAQLVYSTFLGGTRDDIARALSVDARGVAIVAGETFSTSFPTTRGAYQSSHGGNYDAFVCGLDPSKAGSSQLLHSTFLGGISTDYAHALAVHQSGLVVIAGGVASKNFPTTKGAYNTTHNGGTYDAFVSGLDPTKTGNAQLVYSTLLGGRGTGSDFATAVHVDVRGVVTLTGYTSSINFPTTSGAYDSTLNNYDGFVSRLDPGKTGAAQLVYSTFLGGSHGDYARALHVDARGVATVAGVTVSPDFPTTSDAYSRNQKGAGDGFVSRLDPSKTGAAQLVRSTYFGGSKSDNISALAVDASGVVTVAGFTLSTDLPTTSGAYDNTRNGFFYYDAFVTRLRMDAFLYADVHELSIKAGGTQKLTVNAGKTHANLRYWIFGTAAGTTPGIDLLGVHIPLNPDLFTVIAMGAPNSKEFTNFRGTLNANGVATASFNLPASLALRLGATYHYAYVVYDASGKFYMASNAVPLTLIK